MQQVASRLGLTQGSVRHYGLDGDANGVLLMADIVLYGSSQEEQGFPPLYPSHDLRNPFHHT